MLTKTITFTNYLDQESTETLYFNISKAELAENLDLEQELSALAERFAGPERTLSVAENLMILDVIKRVMKLAYGLRSPDGLRFSKNEEIWKEFTESAAYDGFISHLLDHPEEVNEFLLGVFPQDLIDRDELPPEIAEAMARREKPAALKSVPVAPDEDEDVDFTAMLAEANVKEPVTRQQSEYMKAKLKPAQYNRFMSTRYIVD